MITSSLIRLTLGHVMRRSARRCRAFRDYHRLGVMLWPVLLVVNGNGNVLPRPGRGAARARHRSRRTPRQPATDSTALQAVPPADLGAARPDRCKRGARG